MTLQNKTLAVIMGGGAGTRLFPLTQKRAKPAVPLGSKYRLVDIPISNCVTCRQARSAERRFNGRLSPMARSLPMRTSTAR